jgi:hypothetical protein
VLIVVSGCDPEGGTGKSRTETRLFALSGAKLTIDSSESDVRIEAGPGPEVELVRTLKGDPGAKASMTGATLKLTASCFGISVGCAVSDVVKVPVGIALEVKGAGGRVEVAGIRSDVDADMTADAALSVVDPAGRLRLEGKGSNIAVTGASSTDVTATATMDGNLSLSFAAPPKDVVARSTGGSVKVVVPGGSETHRLDISGNDGGGTGLSNDPNSPRHITAVAQDGNVNVTRA